MAISFPTSPTLNQTYTFGSRTWKWNGEGWEAVSSTFGPTGPTGPTGTSGPTGPTGPTGSIYPTGGSPDRIFYENQIVITTNYTITTNYNAGTFGPVTINSGVTITIPSGSVWTIV